MAEVSIADVVLRSVRCAKTQNQRERRQRIREAKQ